MVIYMKLTLWSLALSDRTDIQQPPQHNRGMLLNNINLKGVSNKLGRILVLRFLVLFMRELPTATYKALKIVTIMI